MPGMDTFTMGPIHWETALVVGAVGLFVVVVVTQLGVFLNPMRWQPRRAARRARRRTLRHARQTALVAPRDSAVDGSSGGWAPPLATMDEALVSRDTVAAARAWLAAYRAVRTEHAWEGHLAVGAARLRVAELTGARKEAEAKARELYLMALFRARQQGSVEGILHSVEALAALGDRQVVEQALRLAEGVLAHARDAETQTRLRTILQQLTPAAPERPALESL